MSYGAAGGCIVSTLFYCMFLYCSAFLIGSEGPDMFLAKLTLFFFAIWSITKFAVELASVNTG